MTAVIPEAEQLLAAANRAPSTHNSQPWRFRLRGESVELLADRSRGLPILDPNGRELTISCGAALLNLRIAVANTGRRAHVELLPARDDPDLLARVRVGEPAEISAEDALLYRMIYRRHSHRGHFEDGAIPRHELLELAAAAEHEGALLRFVEGATEAREMIRLVHLADQQQQENPAYRAEIRSWTRDPGTRQRDGVPAVAFPRAKPTEPLAARDFDLGRGWGSEPVDANEVSSTIVLVTPSDTARDWLLAGQALERVLLQAASCWIFAQFHTQPMEVPAIREEVRSRLRLPGVPQVVLRLGYATSAALTPRRPAADTLIS